jgi:tRNA (mo5U34)-methyltransferase
MNPTAPAADPALGDLRREMDGHFWLHTIDLGNGLVTPGRVPAEVFETKKKTCLDGVEFKGKTVLDVGAWNGGYSIEAKRRGAARVVALDHMTWIHPQIRGRESFDFAVRVTGLDIEALELDLEIANALAGVDRFEVVLFLGVFYHLLDPIHVLQQLGRITTDTLVVETHVETFPDPRPAMVFFPTDELSGDPSNWWGPNIACVEALLKTVGFKTISIQQYAPTRAVFHARK